MKRSVLESWIIPVRHADNGIVSFETACGWDNCKHTDFSTVHYGNEDDAKNSAVGKMILHYCNIHGVKLDD